MNGRHERQRYIQAEDHFKTGAPSIKWGVVLVERKIEEIKFTVYIEAKSLQSVWVARLHSACRTRGNRSALDPGRACKTKSSRQGGPGCARHFV